MKWLWTLVLAAGATAQGWADLPKPIATGLKNPESAVVGLDGRIYVTEIGEFDKDGDGKVTVIDGDKTKDFATGLNDPKGIATFQNFLFVTDKTQVVRIDPKGKVTVLAAEKNFPTKPLFLNDIVIDEKGTIYVSDSGKLDGSGGAIYKIDMKGKVTLVGDSKKYDFLKTPNGLLLETHLHLLVVDFDSGDLHRINLETGTGTKLASGFSGGDGLTFDHHGQLFISSWKKGELWTIPRPGTKPLLLTKGFEQAADTCLDPTGKFVVVPDMKTGNVYQISTTVPGHEVDLSPKKIESEIAFPKIEWTDWKNEVNGKLVQLRPITLTHAGDGSNRVFVATQHGVIHTFANDQNADKSKVFLDIQNRVRYEDKENEQGLLGLAFHPKYKENGEFFVFYTVKKPVNTNIVARYKVSKDDPNKADPMSEEEIFRVTIPYWNHDGGTICFGKDGYLYIALGDGGLANDPHENGQNLKTLLGKILRIDVNSKAGDKNYSIPKDNPFINTKDAQPEIYCYGLRNPWRIAFDRGTGNLWCADVGQNLWEEVNIIKAGGNYGWNWREGRHPFGTKGTGPNDKMIEPIWEYHHDVGKSITGGTVYRGTRVKELEGHYLYADYVTNKLFALKYDEKQGRVVANHALPNKGVPVLSFGEDEMGDVYYLTYTASGKGIYRFVAPGK